LQEFDITEFDLFFLSYDEPNAEKHWSDLLDKAPYAERVHGVKGFDAAHRACAEKSGTDWFVTVDADNIVLPSFFDQTVVLDPVAQPNRCFSWNGVNMHNGLQYGNGGIKLWSKNFVLNMNSHENADDPRKAVDFCWEDDYKQVHRVYSEVCVTGSPYQAFKAGFREGVKLTLDRGERLSPKLMKSELYPVNLRNAMIWSCVGAHVENGLWAMLGTRWGWSLMCDMAWDHTRISDYGWFVEFWRETTSECADDAGLLERMDELGQAILDLTNISTPVLDENHSRFFCETFGLVNE
jgi:hypothetical protein